MRWTWYGVEIALYPYLKEKAQQGQVWGLEARNVPGDAETDRAFQKLQSLGEKAVSPQFKFETHAGTFYNVLLPQIRKSKYTQILGCKFETSRWVDGPGGKKGGYQYCEPLIRQGITNDTKMKVIVTIKHPKGG